MKSLTFAAAGLCALAAASAASAQDYTEAPAFGSITVEAGFVPDPISRDLTAGGSIRAETRFSGCRGSIANAPDFSIYYTAGSTFPLIFSVDSDSDTTLVINAPDTSWHCDDDGADEPLNPLVRFNNPQSGRYDVWVGTYSSGAGVPATLFISEIGEHTRANQGLGGFVSSQAVDISLPARYGDIDLNGGFLPDPETVSVFAGGPLSANDAINSTTYCSGYITAEPTLELDYNGSSDLHIYTSGSADTVLAINGPDGRWFCNDDGANGTNAGISFPRGSSGIYDIYVGTFSSGGAQTSLNISEISLNYGTSGK